VPYKKTVGYDDERKKTDWERHAGEREGNTDRQNRQREQTNRERIHTR
jgi:hypothetical protein